MLKGDFWFNKLFYLGKGDWNLSVPSPKFVMEQNEECLSESCDDDDDYNDDVDCENDNEEGKYDHDQDN